MTQYIDKAAVVAELERRQAFYRQISDEAINFKGLRFFYDGMKEACDEIKRFISTLEVKEIDFKENSI